MSGTKLQRRKFELKRSEMQAEVLSTTPIGVIFGGFWPISGEV
jgi:hypothetical protein